MRWSKNEIFLIDYNNAGNSFCTFKLPVSEPSLSIHFCKLKMQEYLLRQRIMNLSISEKLYICYQKNCAYMERSRRWSIFSQVIVWAQKIYVKVFRQGKIFRIFFVASLHIASTIAWDFEVIFEEIKKVNGGSW